MSETTRSDLKKQHTASQEIQARLGASRVRQGEIAKRCADLSWVKEKLPAYRRLRMTLEQNDAALASRREAINDYEAALEESRQALTVRQVRLQEIEKAITDRLNRGQDLAALLTRLDRAKARQRDIERLAAQEQECHLQAEDLARQLSMARDELSMAHSRVAELQATYDTEAANHDVLSSLLARLAEMVHSAECPLCGTAFATVKEAEDTIRGHLSFVPDQLTGLARRLSETKKDAEATQTCADGLATKTHVLERQALRVRSEMAEATKVVQEFLADCRALTLPVSEGDVASWGNLLVQACKDCEVTSLRSEATSFAEEIKSYSVRVAEQQGVVDAYQKELVRHGKQRDRLAAETQEFEADLARRGIDPKSLPENGQQDAELDQTQSELVALQQLIAKDDAEPDGQRVVDCEPVRHLETGRRRDRQYGGSATAV